MVIGDFCFELEEANPSLAKEIHMLNIDPTEPIGILVESMRPLALDCEGVLQGGDPGLESGKGEKLVLGEPGGQMD
jgi:hypothetical protein